jgi:hypothetical protein
MASYDDLTLYTYGTSAEPMLNIGWLDTGSPFPIGDTPPEVIGGLLVLADIQRNIMRGLHDCEFCDEESPVRLPAPRARRGWVSLGMGELHARGEDGVLYSAPSLVIHYILRHRYSPPSPFQAAVLTTVKEWGTAKRLCS